MQNPIYFENIPGASKLDLQTCVLYYQETQNEFIFRIILLKLKDTFNYYLYSKTNYHDKSELLALYEDKLMECLKSYKPNTGAKFITYYSRCLDNALINFIDSSKNRILLSLEYDYNSDQSDSDESCTIETRLGENDIEIENSTAYVMLENIKHKLNENEYNVCKVILNEPHRLQYVEIARELGLTLAAIPDILKRLRKKFKSENILEKI